MSFDLGNYEDVAARRRRLFDIYPDARIQVSAPVYVTRPDATTWVRVAASVYRNGDDTMPGVDWTEEPMPGRTPYTKGSEVENASTSAIGRAILCVLPPLAGMSGASQSELMARHGADDEPAHPLSERVNTVTGEMRRMPNRDKDAMKAWADGRSLAPPALLRDEQWLELVEAWLDEHNKGTNDADA